MIDVLLDSPFFGLGLTAMAWAIGVWLHKKVHNPLCSPLLVALLIVLGVLGLFHISYEQYSIGADFIKIMLTPVTAVLGLNIYQQRSILKEHFFPILVGCLAGSLTSIGSVLLICHLFQVDNTILQSVLPKSATTAIAIILAESRGGLAGIAILATLLAGLTGAVFAPLLSKWFRVTDPVAEGLAIGACSHSTGTGRALEIGSIQGAASSISICLCGIFTSILILFL